MAFHTVFFDLDGTLCDSKPGIVTSMLHALDAFGIRANPEELDQFIGPPLKYTFSHFGFSGNELDRIIAKCRERYVAEGIFELSLYEGIPDMLRSLNAAGKRLILATAKVESSAEHILEHTGIKPYFSVVAGADLAGGRLEKIDILRYAASRSGITGTAGCVMAGDREHDVHGAHELGMPCIGVTYGYGGRRELEEARADAIVDSVDALRARLLEG